MMRRGIVISMPRIARLFCSPTTAVAKTARRPPLGSSLTAVGGVIIALASRELCLRTTPGRQGFF